MKLKRIQFNKYEKLIKDWMENREQWYSYKLNKEECPRKIHTRWNSLHEKIVNQYMKLYDLKNRGLADKRVRSSRLAKWKRYMAKKGYPYYVKYVNKRNKYTNEKAKSRLHRKSHKDIKLISCVKCGSKFKLEKDHIQSLADEGADEKDNIQVLCNICHNIKSSKDNSKVRTRIRDIY